MALRRLLSSLVSYVSFICKIVYCYLSAMIKGGEVVAYMFAVLHTLFYIHFRGFTNLQRKIYMGFFCDTNIITLFLSITSVSGHTREDVGLDWGINPLMQVEGQCKCPRFVGVVILRR